MKMKLIGTLVVVTITLFGWLIWDIQSDRSKSIRIIKEVPLYDEWEPLNGQKSSSMIAPGENLKVNRIRYGKDYMAIKIERESGKSGWVFYQDDAIELSEK